MLWDPPLTNDWYRHPQPLLRRPWADLNGLWRFRYDDDSVGRDEHWFADGQNFEREIVVPFAPRPRSVGLGTPASTRSSGTREPSPATPTQAGE